MIIKGFFRKEELGSDLVFFAACVASYILFFESITNGWHWAFGLVFGSSVFYITVVLIALVVDALKSLIPLDPTYVENALSSVRYQGEVLGGSIRTKQEKLVCDSLKLGALKFLLELAIVGRVNRTKLMEASVEGLPAGYGLHAVLDLRKKFFKGRDFLQLKVVEV